MRAARQKYAVPLLNAMHAWMVETVSQLDNKSDLASAFNYSLNRWEALCRYTQDGRLEIGESPIIRSIASRNCCRGILSINCKNPRKSRMRWRLKSAGSTPLNPHSQENDEHFL
jgi:Transposase IS66 family